MASWNVFVRELLYMSIYQQLFWNILYVATINRYNFYNKRGIQYICDRAALFRLASGGRYYSKLP